jgi:tRNA (cytidine/uridine-2'-O-)-methyltransferase
VESSIDRKGFVIQPADPTWGTAEDRSLHVVLVSPEIPGNTGNIGRLCAGANIWLHLVRPLGFELDNRYLKRAGLDYWPHVRLCVHDSFQEIETTFPRDRIFVFSKKASRLYTDVDYREGAVLVFGRETKGLGDDFLERWNDRSLRIPITEHVRSLNLSNAVAVAVYESMRQLAWTPLEHG